MQAVQEQLKKEIAARDRTNEALRNELAGKETERIAEREQLRQLGQCVIALQAGNELFLGLWSLVVIETLLG
ncbi:hypothetical protein niasHT_014813 [Heterodera trifolii]|uniref:Uncharacterized protein n=1 Tax=Heterodera trifolii TaxID=157864 RepID=A0ABD2L747_9BILA